MSHENSSEIISVRTVIYSQKTSSEDVQQRSIAIILTPPVVRRLNTTSGFRLFSRMPTASSSISRSRRCSSDFVASSMMRMRSAVLAAGGT